MAETTAKDLDERLYRLLQLVNDWLKFAEAKNVGMVGFASSAIAVLLAFLTSRDEAVSVVAAVFIAVGGIGLVLALLVSLASFLPQTDLERMAAGEPRTPQEADNLFYYGHVARYEPRKLVDEMVRSHLRGQTVPVDDSHLDLAGQIVINARITLRKFRLFTFSLVCFAVGVTGSSVGVLIAILQMK